jgi:SAM-dependent methyltransferase
MSVFDRYALYYDYHYTGKDYAAECDFIQQAAARYARTPETVLDLACGTGGHGLLLAERGLRVTGVDRSPQMLRVYRDKADERRLGVELCQQDLRSLELEGRFDLAVCMFDAVGYLTDNADLTAFFQPLPQYLAPNGLLVFDVWHAAPLLRAHDPVRVRELDWPGGRIVRISSTTIDPARQVADVSFHVMVLEGHKLVDEFTEVHPVRYFLPQEIAFILEATGWRVLQIAPAFQLDQPVQGDSWHLAILAEPLSPR